MSIHIHQVLDYLDTHPICREADSMDSLLERIHDIYALNNHLDSEEIRSLLRSMRNLLECLPMERFEEVFAAVSDLCLEHEQLAFSQGVLAGMHLMTEVNTLP